MMKTAPGDEIREATPISTGWIVLVILQGIIVMLFAALTSAYVERVVRTGFSLPFVPALAVSTVVLAVSAMAAGEARKAASRGEWWPARRWLGVTAALGLLFAASQYVAWLQLSGQGIYLQTNPHSSFFYLLTALHVLHLAGGIAWLLVARARLRNRRPWLRVLRGTGNGGAGRAAPVAAGGPEDVSLSTTFWHFLGGLWAFLLALLYIV